MITKNQYLSGFAAIVAVLAIIRCASPSVNTGSDSQPVAVNDTIVRDSVSENNVVEAPTETPVVAQEVSTFKKHRIYSVPSFKEAFPDSQSVQEVAARRWGVKPVGNRADAEHRKKELVYIESNPYFHVDKMARSIPYLVPRAAILLNDIGRAFLDSLYVKGVPLHLPIVTSVLRTKEDVARLRQYNGNATENSCHLFGTTFDICYNRYKTVSAPDEQRRKVQDDTLKWVLSEVLRDMRQQQRCYIKYEVKQGCFHITVR